jgi:chromate reductase
MVLQGSWESGYIMERRIRSRHRILSGMTPLRILAISGSLRALSSNTELLRAAALLDPSANAVSIYGGLADLPHFNPDDDREGSILPPAVVQLRAQVAAADAVLVSSPEYAHGVPGSLKNALDWLVSGSEMPGKPVGVLTASAHAVHAPASLVETLGTMSALVVRDAVRVVRLSGRRMDAAAILGDPELADELRAALRALGAAVAAQGRLVG